MLEAYNITAGYGSKTILEDICFSLETNDILMLIGPNGAGKSTLIRCISGALPYKGKITLMGSDLKSFSNVQRAQNIGILSQKSVLEYSFTVREVVRLGRYAHRQRILGKSDTDGEKCIASALEITGLSEYADRSVLSLSGGEIQRVFLAQVLAQDPKLMILDEPANHLDLKYQKQVFEMLRSWAAVSGHAVIAAVHDLNLARHYATKILLLSDGKGYGGSVQEVFSPEIINTAYSMDVSQWMKQIYSRWE